MSVVTTAIALVEAGLIVDAAKKSEHAAKARMTQASTMPSNLAPVRWFTFAAPSRFYAAAGRAIPWFWAVAVAFALASILALLALVTLVLKTALEWRFSEDLAATGRGH